MEFLLGYALGDIAPELVQDLTVTLPDIHLPGWSAREAATSTDGLLAVAASHAACPWTTLLVTPWLGGGTSLEQALVTLKLQWPTLRIAVLFGADTPEYRPLLTTLAAYRIWNCLIADEFDFADLVHLVTDDWPWDAIQPFLGRPEGMAVPVPAALPQRVVVEPTGAKDAVPAVAVAVVSAQGRSGKTSWIANALWATASWGSMAIDLDVEKPALPLYFRAANDPYPVHLQQLLTGLSKAAAPGGDGAWRDRLTPQDKQEIRAYLQRAVAVTPGARLVPGPLRQHTMTPRVPPGLATAMIREAKRMARVVWVDLPGRPTDPVWEEAIRTVDQVVVVTPPETVAVLETLALFERLDRLRVPRSAVRLVVNRVGPGGLPPHEIATVHLQHPLLAAIPDQPKRWEAAVRTHRPLAAQHRRFWARLVAPFRPPESVGGRIKAS